MNGMNLTKRQREILEYLRECFESRGGAPSLREIMERFGFSSPATVSGHLRLMEKKGVIRRVAGRSRNIVLAGRREGVREVPLYGTIPAGMPEGREEDAGRMVVVDPGVIRLLRGARVFALAVRGDSMVGAGILDGDMAILEQVEPRHLDIVAALIDGEATLKRYLLRDGRPFLRAENPAYPDLVPARELVVQGVFRGLLRGGRA